MIPFDVCNNANNGTWRNFFHKKQVSPFKKAILLFKKPVSHLKTSMITLSQNFVSERAKSKLVTKLANQYHIFKKTDSHSKKPVSHFKKAVSHFKKAVSHFKKHSKNMVSLRICPRVSIHRKRERQKNNLTVPSKEFKWLKAIKWWNKENIARLNCKPLLYYGFYCLQSFDVIYLDLSRSIFCIKRNCWYR